MKVNYYLILLLITLSSAVKAQNSWTEKKLDDKISVKFPKEPEKLVKNGTESYILKEPDSVAYSAVAIDLNVLAHLDSATLSQMKDNQEFADQFMKGVASQKPNYTFGDVTIGQWKTFTTYNVSGVDNKTKSTLFVQMIIIGSKIYTLSCRIPANMAPNKKEAYFNNVALLK